MTAHPVNDHDGDKADDECRDGRCADYKNVFHFHFR